MTSIDSVVLEVHDAAAAKAFYAAFGVDDRVAVRASDAPTSGFRSFTVSLIVSQPSIVDGFFSDALAAGATATKPVAKSLWGYAGVVQAPDGTIWKVATSSKKNKGPDSRAIDNIALLIGVADVAASKRFYVEHGLTVGKSFGGKYVEFANPSKGVKLALYGHRALAKDAGVPAEGSGSHRIAIVGDTADFSDPDGFTWEPASLTRARVDVGADHAH